MAKQLSVRHQPRNVLGSFGVVLMSCKVNFHVARPALQNSRCLLRIFLLIGSSIDPTFWGILVCTPLQFKCQFLTSTGHIFCVFHWAAVGKNLLQTDLSKVKLWRQYVFLKRRFSLFNHVFTTLDNIKDSLYSVDWAYNPKVDKQHHQSFPGFLGKVIFFITSNTTWKVKF